MLLSYLDNDAASGIAGFEVFSIVIFTSSVWLTRLNIRNNPMRKMMVNIFTNVFIRVVDYLQLLQLCTRPRQKIFQNLTSYLNIEMHFFK